MSSTVERPPTANANQRNDAVSFWLTNRSYISKLNAEYPYWVKVKAKAKADGYDPVQVWEALKQQRFISTIHIEQYETFSLNIPSTVQRLLHELDLHCGGSLQSLLETPINERQKKTFIISSLRTEAYSSSTLEGAVATKERAKEIIKSKKRPKTEGELMIFNNYQAMEYIIANKDNPLTIDALFTLHDILTKHTLDASKAGRFRNENENISIVDVLNSESIYTPPSATELRGRMDSLVKFFNAKDTNNLSDKNWDETFIHPIVKAALIHFWIGYIHPFYDGNGRIARALFYWHMLANGYWLAEYLSISQIILKSRGQYYKSFQYVENDNNDLTYFVHYHIRALGQSFDALLKYLDKKINKQRNEAADVAAEQGINMRQAEIYTLLKDSPTVWTLHQVQNKIHVSANTARADLNALTEKGLLERINLDKKTQAWRLI